MNTYTHWHLGVNRGGHYDTSPKWEYTNAISYSCSSDSRNYHEKTDPYADGYAFREQKDTNPYSKTFGDTRLVRYSAWDDKCKGEIDDSPKWSFTGHIGCSSSPNYYEKKIDIYADGYAFYELEDINPYSPTYNEKLWLRARDRDDECKGQTDTSPTWEYIDSSSYSCSSSSSSYREKSDIYADGYAFRELKDTNPYSKTFGDTRLVRYSAWDDKCKGEIDDSPKWSFTGHIGCSSSPNYYEKKIDIYADGYAFYELEDINPYSPTYNEKLWLRARDRDDECKGQTDTSPTWEYIDSSSYSCSSSSSSYREKSDIYADGYAFRKQKDTNPDSDTYGDTKWVRYSSWDSKCVGEERPVDRTPHWETTSILGCSSSSTSYKEKTDPYADGYAFVKYKDTNPNSPSYNDIEWRRTSYMDDQCVGEERPYQPTYTFTAEDYDVTGDSSIDITSHKTVEEGGTTHVQWTVDEITGDGAEFIEKAVSAGGNTSLTIKLKEGPYINDKKAVITLRQSESGKTIEINVTTNNTGHVEPPVSNDMFAPCDRKYTYDLNCDFRPINIPICSVYNNKSAKPMVHGYEGRLFDYVRIEEGAGLVIGWSSEAIKSTKDFSTAIILQQEGSGKEFEIKFNVTPCPPPQPCELTVDTESITFTLKNYDFDDLDVGFTTDSITQTVDYNLTGTCGSFFAKWEYESFLPSDYDNAITCEEYGVSDGARGSVAVTFTRDYAPYVFDYIRKYEGSDRMLVGELYIGDFDTPQIEKPFETAIIPVYVITKLE